MHGWLCHQDDLSEQPGALCDKGPLVYMRKHLLIATLAK